MDPPTAHIGGRATFIDSATLFYKPTPRKVYSAWEGHGRGLFGRRRGLCGRRAELPGAAAGAGPSGQRATTTRVAARVW